MARRAYRDHGDGDASHPRLALMVSPAFVKENILDAGEVQNIRAAAAASSRRNNPEHIYGNGN